MIGRMITTPTSTKIWLERGAEAAQMLRFGGTMFGKMLISSPL